MGKGWIRCDVKDCKRHATGRAGPLRVCNMHWMRWYRSREADEIGGLSDHMSAHYKDAMLLRRLDLFINEVRPEAAQEDRYALFSEIFVEGLMGARDVYRLLSRSFVDVVERGGGEVDAFTREQVEADVVIRVASEGQRALRAIYAQDRMVDMENARQYREALDARRREQEG